MNNFNKLDKFNRLNKLNQRKGEALTVADAAVVLPETQQELSRLYREHHRRVLIAAYRITGSMADAEDITHAVFVRLISSDGQGVTNAASYLYRSAINGSLDLLRRRKNAATESLEKAAQVATTHIGSSPEAMRSRAELSESLRLAIGELSPRSAEMFVLRYIEEFDNREIAGMLGTSRAVVAVTLHNARSRLKNRLREMDGRRK